MNKSEFWAVFHSVWGYDKETGEPTASYQKKSWMAVQSDFEKYFELNSLKDDTGRPRLPGPSEMYSLFLYVVDTNKISAWIYVRDRMRAFMNVHPDVSVCTLLVVFQGVLAYMELLNGSKTA